AVVHVDRQRHGDRALWIRGPFAVAFIHVQIIGDDRKLITRHFKNLVVVNSHGKSARGRRLRISAFANDPSTPKAFASASRVADNDPGLPRQTGENSDRRRSPPRAPGGLVFDWLGHLTQAPLQRLSANEN